MEKMPRFYLVTVIIRPEGFRKIYLEGIFLPRDSECSVGKIKKQCWDYLNGSGGFVVLGINPDKVDKEIKVKALPNDFLVCEDKL